MFEFIQDKNLTRSIEFAKMIQTQVCRAANRPNKGVHQQNLAVLRLTSMPACLIELGYISTPSEERLLNSKDQVDNIVRGLYNAFVQYKNKYDTGMTIPYKPISDPAPEPQPDKRIDKAADTGNNQAADAPAETRSTDNNPVQASAKQQQPDVMPQQAKPSQPKQVATKQQPPKVPTGKVDNARPVFKVQILVSQRRLKPSDHNFKGLEGCDSYEEAGMQKYTYGASNNYNEIYRLRKEILDKFPGAFIIAFKNGEKMDVNQGIREFKQNRNK